MAFSGGGAMGPPVQLPLFYKGYLRDYPARVFIIPKTEG
jgi:hypothetical protein